MKKLIALAVAGLCVTSLVSVVTAQSFELGIDAGYGLAAGGQQVGANETYDASGAVTKYEDIYASGGNGMKIGVDATMFFTENLGAMLASGYSFLGGYTEQRTAPTVTGKNVWKSSYLPINAGLKLRAKLGGITPYVYAAPGLYIVSSSGEQTVTGVTTTTKYTEKFSPGFGFTSGIGLAFVLSEQLGLKVEVNPTYAFANLTEETTNDGTGTTTTDKYQNNTTTLPADITTGTAQIYYYHGQPRVSFSSIALRAGVSIGF